MDPKIKQSVKNVDGFFASYFSSQISPYFVWFFAKIKVSPNFVTILSFLVAGGAAIFILRDKLIFAAVLIQLSFILDCADGQLARYLNKSSKFGAWLDTLFDRLKEFILVFVIALDYFWKTQNYKIFIFSFLTILVLAMRHYDLDKRRSLGVYKDRSEEKSVFMTPSKRFFAILKESLLFGISERWALITLCLIFNQILLMYYLLIILNAGVTIFKSSYSWSKYRNS